MMISRISGREMVWVLIGPDYLSSGQSGTMPDNPQRGEVLND